MLVFENVFKNVAPEVRREIMALWKSEGALMENERIEERLGQVVYIIRDSPSGLLAGVSTAEKKRVQALNNNYFYEFRCFIVKRFRVAGLDIKLSKLTIDYLESISTEDKDRPIGVFAILENEELKRLPRMQRAYWPATDMYFVGFTSSGNSIHVHYFKLAKI